MKKKQPIPFKNTEILMKALFLNSKYSNLLKEISAKKSLFKSPYDYWYAFHKIAMYQNNVQRIILIYSK